jgi:hypothetical protein
LRSFDDVTPVDDEEVRPLDERVDALLDEHIDGLFAKLGVDRSVDEEERRFDLADIATRFVKPDDLAPRDIDGHINGLWSKLGIKRRGRKVWVDGLPYRDWLVRLYSPRYYSPARRGAPRRRVTRRLVARRCAASRDGPGRSTDDPPDLPLAGSRSLRRAA